MKNHYIQAVLELIHQGKNPDDVISGLAKLLKAKGHESLFASVLAGVLRELESKSERAGGTVTVAKTADEQNHVELIKRALTSMGGDESYTLKEDDTLIGGFIAEVNNTVHDESHKTALVNLYRRLTS